MVKKICLILSVFFSIYIGTPRTTYAFDNYTFVSFINEVRGLEGWNQPGQSPLDLPIFQYQEATHSATPITWLLRFDIVNDASFSGFFKKITSLDSTQSLGGLLEITPALANVAGTPFSSSQQVLLTGYSQADRLKIIDSYMESFFTRFGTYPKVVGSTYIDSFSLKYLSEKYSVVTAAISDERYDANLGRVWGSYFSSPYYPSKINTLVPASDSDHKINLVVTRFTANIDDDTTSDYNTPTLDNLLRVYSNKKFNEFTQINLGLANHRLLNRYRQEIKSVYKLISDKTPTYQLKVLPLAEFGEWFLASYPESSPAYMYQLSDLTDLQAGEVFWYQNPFYRVGIKNTNNGNSQIVDFRLFNQDEGEQFLYSPSQANHLYAETPSIIDSQKYPSTQIDLNFKVTSNSLILQKNSWTISATDSSKTIRFEPHKIAFSGFLPPTIDDPQIKSVNSNNETAWHLSAKLPFSSNYKPILFLTIILLTVIICLKKISVSTTISAVIVSSVVLLTVFRSGMVFPFGMGFWGPNGHDAIFHLSLVNSLSQSPLSLNHPQFSGQKIQNYHIAYDFLVSILVRITSLPASDLYFRLLPLAMTLIIIWLLSVWLKKLGFSRPEINLTTFLAFLTGSLGFLATLIQRHTFLAGESVFWSNQSVSIALNPPFMLSIIVLLAILVLLESKIDNSILKILAYCLLAGILVQTKVYAFILLTFALIVCRMAKPAILAVISGSVFVLPTLGLSGLPFIFSPLWFVSSMLSAQDRLGFPELSRALQNFAATGEFSKYALISIFSIGAFVIGNLGIRTIGLFSILRRSPSHTSQKIAYTICIIGIILPLLFIQKSNPWNTIQFMYYSLFFLSVPTARRLFLFLHSNRSMVIKSSALLLISIFGLTTTIGTLLDYISPMSASRISNSELHLLDKLKRLPVGIVISPPYSLPKSHTYSPLSLYNYTSTAYISALSGQPEFLSDTVNLTITGINFQEREKEIQKFYNTQDEEWANDFLKRNQIRYIYERSEKPIKIEPNKLCLVKIFDSDGINLYKVNCYDQNFGGR